MQATAGQEHRYEICCGLMILIVDVLRYSRQEPNLQLACHIVYTLYLVPCSGLEKRQREKYGEEEKYRSALEGTDHTIVVRASYLN